MPDIATVTAAIGGIKTAIEIAKALRLADTSIGEAEQKLRIADLMTALAESQVQLAEIQISLIDKDEEIKRLKASLNPDIPVIRHSEAYFEVDDEGNPIRAPYCSYCYESEHLLIHTSQNQSKRMESTCPRCKNSYKWQSYIYTKEEKAEREAAKNV